MARIAFIKMFTGLNLAPAQLAAEMVTHGHDANVFYFKDYQLVSEEEAKNYVWGHSAGPIHTSNGQDLIWGVYKPITDQEMDLLIQALDEYKPDAIGFCIHVGIIQESRDVAKRLRKRLAHLPFLVGGAAPTLEPERFTDDYDIVCLNEGEEVVVEFGNRIDAREDLFTIAGTWAKKPNGELVKNPKRPNLDIDSIAIPNWELSRYAYIENNQLKKGKYPSNLRKEYPIMTQRGCPFSCSFCFESKHQEMHGKTVRRRSVQLVLDELKWAKEHLKIKSVQFYDDVFTIHPRWLQEFMPRYKEEIGLPFWCYTYPTTHNPEMLKLLKDNGCHSMTMGVQTGSERLLRDVYNRPTKIKRVIEAAQEMVDAGIIGFFDLITIGPMDTMQDLHETFEFLLQFPKQMKNVGFGHMALLPQYHLTDMVPTNERPADGFLCSTRIERKVYDYYHRLYRLTRTDMPTEQIRNIAADPQYRENPKLLDQFFNPEKWDMYFLAGITDAAANISP